MPERQPSSGEATEQQVTPPASPDDGTRDGATGTPASAPSGNGAPARPSPAPRPAADTAESGTGQSGSGPNGSQDAPGSTNSAGRSGADPGAGESSSGDVGAGDRSPDGRGTAEQDAGGRTGAGVNGSQADTRSATSGVDSPPPSPDVHDGATPHPTAPGRDPGPQAGGGLFTPRASGPGPTAPATPGATGPAAGQTSPAPTSADTAQATTALGAQAAPGPQAQQNPGGQPAGPGNQQQNPGSQAGTRPADAPPGNGPGNGPTAGGAELFGSWDDESTRVLPRVPGAATDASTQRMRAAGPPATGGATAAGVGAAGASTAAMAATGPTVRTQAAGGPTAGGPPPAAHGPSGGGDGPSGQDPDAGGSGRRPRRIGLLIAAGVVGIVVLAYLGDLLFSSGSVPRGVTVAGQDIGGLSRAAAIERLQSAIEPRSGQPVQVTAGPVRSQIDPRTAGLSVDYDGTLDRAGAQPLNPITRVSSFFTTRDVGVVNKADERSVRTAMEQLVPLVDRDPKDGTVRFEGLNPVPVAPVPGQQLDVDAAVTTLEQQWATGAPVALPLIVQQAATTPGDVQTAIDKVAKPAVSGPLTVTGEGANATVAPEDIAKALTFKADPAGAQKLVPQINAESITDVVTPQLEKTEKPGVDATLDFASNPPKVVPSQDGRGIDYKASLANLLPVLTGTGPRTVAAVYAVKPPDITTDQIQSLGGAGEVSTFTTGGFAADSGQNIKRAAEAIDGKIVKPGETFSLNGATDPRDASTGYVDAGIIEDGHPARGVGGRCVPAGHHAVQRSYFAGMVDVEHKEHSFYISRYPVAREATVFENLIDVKFRNDGPTAVLIKTAWTPSTITVTFFGTKQYEVSSQSGPKTDFTDPRSSRSHRARSAKPSSGAKGFHRHRHQDDAQHQDRRVHQQDRTVKYNPSPIVKCGG